MEEVRKPPSDPWLDTIFFPRCYSLTFTVSAQRGFLLVFSSVCFILMKVSKHLYHLKISSSMQFLCHYFFDSRYDSVRLSKDLNPNQFCMVPYKKKKSHRETQITTVFLQISKRIPLI